MTFLEEVNRQRSCLKIRRLSTGYWHIRGYGPNNWTQPPEWPCDEGQIKLHADPNACDEFIWAVRQAARALKDEKENK